MIYTWISENSYVSLDSTTFHFGHYQPPTFRTPLHYYNKILKGNIVIIALLFAPHCKKQYFYSQNWRLGFRKQWALAFPFTHPSVIATYWNSWATRVYTHQNSSAILYHSNYNFLTRSLHYHSKELSSLKVCTCCCRNYEGNYVLEVRWETALMEDWCWWWQIVKNAE